MDNISPIWIRIEGQWPGGSTVKTQIDMHGVSLPTTSQVENAYRSELTGLYEILSILEYVCQLYHLSKV